MLKHTSPISGIANYKDQYVATAGYDNRVILWDAKTKTPLSVGYHDHLANQCVFSPCGKYLATAGSDNTARLWKIPEMQLLTVYSGHLDDVECVSFHPQLPILATSSQDHRIRIFTIDGKLLKEMRGHSADVISIVWLGNTGNLISTSDDGTVKRWDTHAGTLIEDIDLGGVETDTITVSPNGTIYAGNDKGQILLIKEKQTIFIDAHKAGIKRLVYDDSKKMLISLSYDRTARLWSIQANGMPEVERTIDLPYLVWPKSGAFLNESEIAFPTFGSSYAKYNHVLDKWDMNSVAQTNGINTVNIEDGDVFIAGDSGIIYKNGEKVSSVPSLCNFTIKFRGNIIAGGQTGEVFNVSDGEVIYQHRSPINCATKFVINNIEYLIIGTYTGEGLLFQADFSGCLKFTRSVQLHENAIKNLVSSSEYLFSACSTGDIAFHSLETLDLVRHIKKAHTQIANSCCNFGENFFASVGRDRKLIIWNSFKPRIIDTPHSHSIKSVASTSNGKYIATGSYAGYVMIYHQESSSWIIKERLTTSGISSLIFDERNNQFLASSYDGNIYPVGLN